MIKRFFNFIFEKLFKINDSPHRIALGFGLGVFAGIFPGAGAVASLFLAFIFKANRAAALAGSLLTNTWLSLVTFVLAIKAGSVILNLDWQNVYQKYNLLRGDFSWQKLFKYSFLEIVFPVVTGYIIIGLISGLFSYFLALLIIRRNPKWKTSN